MLLRFFGILLLVATLLIEPASAQSSFPYMVRVKTDRVYVRAGQNVNFETIAVVNKGDTLVVLAKSFTWLKVKVPPQVKAYLKAEYATMVTPEIGEVKADKVNVRSAANTGATVIGKLERGQRFYFRAKEGDWLALKPLDQLSGWVKEEFVEAFKGAAVPAKLYPDPMVVAATSPAAPAWAQFIKKLDNGDIEASGLLKRNDQGVYQLVRDAVVICTLSGPEAALSGFVGSSVKVRGTPIPGKDAEAPVVKFIKISRLL